MSRSMPYARRLAAVVALAAIAPACRGSSNLMDEANGPVAPLAPSPNAAQLVFIRASGFAFGINFLIFDQHGAFLGESVAKSHFAASLAPGEYLFVAKGENTAILRAHVAAGKTYYVRVEAHMGVWRARVSMQAVHPRTEIWDEAKRELADSRRLLPRVAEGQAMLDGRRADVDETIANAQKDWGGLSASERADRTLASEDGEGGGETAPPPATEPAPPAPPPAQVSTPTPPPSREDLVILKDGSRFRGAVSVGHPGSAGDDVVSVRLMDGSTRSFKPTEVQDIRYGVGPRLAAAQPAPAPRVDPSSANAGRAKVNCNPPYDVDELNRKVFKPECYLRSGQ
jgi:hypothetical protein